LTESAGSGRGATTGCVEEGDGASETEVGKGDDADAAGAADENAALLLTAAIALTLVIISKIYNIFRSVCFNSVLYILRLLPSPFLQLLSI